MDETADDGATAAVLAKVLAMTFLGVSSFVAGSTPVCVFERLGIRQNARGAANVVLRLVLNFGGGVLLCTTFLHLLPEVREGVEQLTDDGTLDKESPVNGVLAELIMCAGFFFMFAVEELVHGLADGRGCHAHDDQHNHDHDQHHQHHQHHRGHGHNSHPHPSKEKEQRDNSDGGSGQTNHGFERDKEQVAAVACRMANYNSCSSVVDLTADTLAKVPEKKQPPQSSVLRGFLIVGALSIHELFEGLAVGLEKNPAQVWSLAVAVACHKVVIAFYVGLQMLSDNTKPLLAHCSILLFAVTSPIGIGAGALVSHLDASHDVVIVSVVLQGLATGTLMYVVFFEVLKPSVGRLSMKQRTLRLVFIAVGFATMLSIQLLISEE